MVYMGSKNRISKHITPIIQSLIDNNDVHTYYEPFCGGLNIIDKISCENRIGNDIHPYLIALLKAIQSGWIPPDMITKEEYDDVHLHKEDYPDYYVGLVGFCASFGAKWFNGYARRRGGINGIDKRHKYHPYVEAIRNLMRQAPNIKDIQLLNNNYLDVDMSVFQNAVIYCDPPYHDVTRYHGTTGIDYDTFCDWCRKVAETNIVCVSEYSMPDDFTCIWQKEVLSTLKFHRKQKNKEFRSEKLFLLNAEKYGMKSCDNHSNEE